MDIPYSEIGRRMRSMRKALRMTQAQLAEAAGIDASFYGQIERGANVPSLKTFLAIARALGAEPSDLLGEGKHRESRFYEGAIKKLIRDLDSSRRRLLLDLIGDIAHRLKR